MTLPWDIHRIRQDFPVLHQEVHGQPLVYLDNAATTLKPQVVIDTVSHFCATDYANVRRGVHTLSARATTRFEAVRSQVQRFINAANPQEIIFVRGVTEGVNLVAHGLGQVHFAPGDEIILTELEHHANIVPWFQLAQRLHLTLRVLPIRESGELALEQLETLWSPRTKLFALTHVSNALGTINPLATLLAAAKARGVPTLVDGAQAIAHLPVDVQALGCDFYLFSGHKLYAPSGIGVLYARQDWLQRLPPYQTGGEMVLRAGFDAVKFAPPPAKFEAGTPNIEGVIGLGAALDYLQRLGLAAIAAHENQLLAYATAQLATLDGLRIIGTAQHKSAILSFLLDKIHAHDAGTILDKRGVAVRVGHHCAMPVMQHFCVAATTRASFAFYNTCNEVDRLVAALAEVIDLFAYPGDTNGRSTLAV